MSVKKGGNRGEKEGLVCPAARPSQEVLFTERGQNSWFISSFQPLTYCNDVRWGLGLLKERKFIWYHTI